MTLPMSHPPLFLLVEVTVSPGPHLKGDCKHSCFCPEGFLWLHVTECLFGNEVEGSLGPGMGRLGIQQRIQPVRMLLRMRVNQSSCASKETWHTWNSFIQEILVQPQLVQIFLFDNNLER
ncbi:Hypothetical predicted protein [Marmota monax]|uniref:Uncharacterized protein n=1 Tax=Marmota monax TaxID=9995 RepID=A0A5E4CAI7_MARMO|nr:Hypothetical predicted protein [Marmota monax]